jgi:2-phospho-L-lactate guanylyltransferase
MRLVRSMLDAVLAAASQAHSISQIIVISPERDRVPSHIPVLADTGDSLNVALAHAHSLLRELGCRNVVILQADLPTLRGEEIDALVHGGRNGGFAIATDATGTGTNALCLTAPVAFQFQFGRHSPRAHLEEARRLRLGAEVIGRPGLAFDVDSPEDLDALKALSWDCALRA